MQAKGKWKMIVMSAALTGAVAAAPMSAGAESTDGSLHKGMKDSDVKPVQKQLKHFDYYKDQVDGTFGKNTHKAVSEFQGDYNIDEDGIFGSNTADTLKKVKSLQKKFNNAPLLRQGDEGKKVKALQNQLQRLKYYKGNLDGIFGPNTETSTKSFQKTNDIAVDGIAGPDTYKALTHNPEKANADKSGKQDKKNTKAAQPSKAKKASANNSKAKKASTSHHKTKNTSTKSSQANGKSITVKSTAYTAHCSGCTGITATGVNLKKNSGKKVIAVDPDVIPLGSTVQVPGYGKAVAADTGGDINGKRIDVFLPGKKKASNYGMKTITVQVLD